MVCPWPQARRVARAQLHPLSSGHVHGAAGHHGVLGWDAAICPGSRFVCAPCSGRTDGEAEARWVCSCVRVGDLTNCGLLARRGPCAEPHGRPGVRGQRFRAQAQCPFGLSASCTSCPGVEGPPTAGPRLRRPPHTLRAERPAAHTSLGLAPPPAGPLCCTLPRTLWSLSGGPTEAWGLVSPSPGSAGWHRGAGPRAGQGPGPSHHHLQPATFRGHFTNPSAAGLPREPAEGPWPTRPALARLFIYSYEVRCE